MLFLIKTIYHFVTIKGIIIIEKRKGIEKKKVERDKMNLLKS
jgi:hypothetical protein